MTKDRVSDAVKREAAQGQKMLADNSRQLYEEWAKANMYPSTFPGGRGAVSQLGGVAQPAQQPKTKSR
jgi:hypothetical protein